jgi:chromosome segregation ATPase
MPMITDLLEHAKALVAELSEPVTPAGYNIGASPVRSGEPLSPELAAAVELWREDREEAHALKRNLDDWSDRALELRKDRQQLEAARDQLRRESRGAAREAAEKRIAAELEDLALERAHLEARRKAESARAAALRTLVARGRAWLIASGVPSTSVPEATSAGRREQVSDRIVIG